MDAAEKLARILDLRAASQSKLAGLARMGVGDIGLGLARLETVVEAMLPWEDGTNEARLDLELGWEERVTAVLEQVELQATRAKLLAGVDIAPPQSTNGHR